LIAIGHPKRQNYRWANSIFEHYLQIALISAHKLYKFKTGGKGLKYADFRMRIAFLLIYGEDDVIE
jgi:hypothetical protein